MNKIKNFIDKKSKLLNFRNSLAMATLLLAFMVGGIFYANSKSQGDVVGWIQNNWSTLDAGVTASPVADLTRTWTKFFSEDTNVIASTSGVTISGASKTFTDSGTNFNTGTTKTNVYTNGTDSTANLTLLKPDGATCTANAECATGWCNANVCTNPWQNVSACRVGGGATGNQMLVYKFDVAGTPVWETTTNACIGPQCAGGVLVADNAVDFSAYPARNACKAVGGRLPNRAELNCIYSRKASYIGAFQAYFYWSGEQYSALTGNAFAEHFCDTCGGVGDYYKLSNGFYTRCVLGQ